MKALLLSVFCALVMNVQAMEIKKDTIDQYIIDKKVIERFDGTQLEGKTILKYIPKSITFRFFSFLVNLRNFRCLGYGRNKTLILCAGICTDRIDNVNRGRIKRRYCNFARHSYSSIDRQRKFFRTSYHYMKGLMNRHN